jgi:cytidyltransferase-like protein
MKLGEYLVNLLLEEDNKTIAIFPGAFKPPHIGHYKVVKQLSTLADEVIVLISPKSRDGVSAEESFAVWQLYAPFLDSNVSFKIAAESPVSEAYDVIKNNPDQKFIVAFGKGEGDRFNQIKTSGKYNNASIYDAGSAEEGISATYLRNALRWKNSKEIEKYIPNGVDVEEFKNALSIATPEKVQESSPIEFEQDDYQDYILNQRDKIEKAASYFNLPISDMEYAFNAGRPVVLGNDSWIKLENANSFNIMDLEHAIRYAHGKGIKVKPYIDAIRNGEELPLPLVLNYSQDKYYLVAGDVILSLYRALKQIPTVLQATLNLQINENKVQKKSQIAEFVKFAINELGIQKLPTVKFSYDTNESQEKSTFGYFDPNANHIWIYIKNRNTADILRTLAHELVHHKQGEDNRIEQGSGETGSEIENEANAQAGVLLRKFGKDNKEIYESVMIEKKNQYREYALTELFEKDLPIIDKVSKNLYIVSNDNDIEAKYDFRLEIPEKNIWSLNWFFTPDNKNKSPEAWKQVTATSFKVLEDWLKTNHPKSLHISGNNDIKTSLYKNYATKLQTLLNNRYRIDNSDEYKVVLRSIEEVAKDNIKKRMETMNESYDQSLDYYQNGDINSKSKIERNNSILKKIKREVLKELYNINEEQQYKIYCDLDGVIVDFEDGYERLTGKNIKGNHVKGDEDFWQPITDAGIKFWAGLKWMPDGKELWSYIKPYNPKILSAPSREESSKIGKHVWVKNNISDTKLILRSAERKQELAEPNAILIDDREDNIQQWKDAGGIGILHTSANDTIKQLQKLKL